MAHSKCAGIDITYLNGPKRFPVSPDQVPWNVKYPEYNPVKYTAPSVAAGPVWADKKSKIEEIRFNTLDGKVNRVSHTGVYKISESGLPINPVGRTGIEEQGLLGKFGPNHAADPLVTRWKKDAEGNRVKDAEGLDVLEFVAIKRGDTGEWAIPGGMVEAGDTVSLTLRKEFGEEALNSIEADEKTKTEIEAGLIKLFANGKMVYSGYVDDPRNTDNAWMETVVMNFHDEEGTFFNKFKLKAGDDAGDVAWVAIRPGLKLYASHNDFVQKVRAMHN